MLGRTVTVSDRVARMVSLAPSLTESVDALGAEEQLAGVAEYCDFPPVALKKPKAGGLDTPKRRS